ncbi:hypothetical protein M3F30_04445 [Corynebacterium sanguinis]|uniref:hypothetical protein n=1 Tax=Corynebacterium sanguinis TaxID=2594913 RepID=UPI00223AEC1E|nr:hypothetical protein [Corynebacterium sanguinis]MCT2287835.1 hypothetical protein [Corynebacterium sanguinis]
MPKPNTITDEQKARAIELRKSGYTLREIRNEVGVSIGHLSRLLNAAGVTGDTSRTLEASLARFEAARGAIYDLLSDLLDDAASLRERMFEPFDQWISTPDGPVKVTLQEPPLSEVAKLSEALRRTLVEINRLQAELDRGSDTDRTRGMLQDLFDGFKMIAALAEPDNNPGTYDSDYDVNADPKQLAQENQ